MSVDLYELAAAIEPKPAKRPLPLTASALVFFTFLWCLIALPVTTNAGTSFEALCLLFPLSLAVAASWLMTLIAIADAFEKPDPRTIRVYWRCSGLILFTLLVGFSGIGFTARLWLSHWALERYVQSLPVDSFSSEPQGVVGLFLVHGYQKDENGVVFLYTTQSGMLDRAGVLFVPVDAPIPMEWWAREHQFGPWYWCLDRF